MLKDPQTVARIEKRRQVVTQSIAEEVKRRMKGFPSSHDWWHIERVRRLGAHIARIEGADLYIVDLALLLHNIEDPISHWENRPASARTAKEIMQRHRVNSSVVQILVCEIIDTMSLTQTFSGEMHTLEGEVAQDANRLDAMGEIGIGRAFAVGGHKHQPLLFPAEGINSYDDVRDYFSEDTRSVLEYISQKLLCLKKLMRTGEGKRLAKRRHSALAKFVHHFREEWELKR